MKAEFNRSISIVLLVINVVAFSSCKKKDNDCDGETEKTQHLEQADLEKLIYKGTEKLTFLDSNTNTTHVFVGHGYTTDYGTTYTQDDCSIKYNLERKYVSFTCATYSAPIFLSLLRYEIDGNGYIQVEFNNSSFKESANSIRAPFTYDSVSIQGKTYYDVEYFWGCCYNLTQGILKMETTDGHKWELLKIDTL